MNRGGPRFTTPARGMRRGYCRQTCQLGGSRSWSSPTSLTRQTIHKAGWAERAADSASTFAMCAGPSPVARPNRWGILEPLRAVIADQSGGQAVWRMSAAGTPRSEWLSADVTTNTRIAISKRNASASNRATIARPRKHRVHRSDDSRSIRRPFQAGGAAARDCSEGEPEPSSDACGGPGTTCATHSPRQR